MAVARPSLVVLMSHRLMHSLIGRGTHLICKIHTVVAYLRLKQTPTTTILPLLQPKKKRKGVSVSEGVDSQHYSTERVIFRMWIVNPRLNILDIDDLIDQSPRSSVQNWQDLPTHRPSFPT